MTSLHRWPVYRAMFPTFSIGWTTLRFKKFVVSIPVINNFYFYFYSLSLSRIVTSPGLSTTYPNQLRVTIEWLSHQSLDAVNHLTFLIFKRTRTLQRKRFSQLLTRHLTLGLCVGALNRLSNNFKKLLKAHFYIIIFIYS